MISNFLKRYSKPGVARKLMPLRCAASALISAFISNTAAAAEWTPILRIAGDTTQVYVESESVIRKGESLRVWLRKVVDRPPPNKPPLTAQESVWFKCDTMDWALVSIFLYVGTDDSGELLQHQTWPFSPDRFKPLKPGSDMEQIGRYLCAKPLQRF